jgi:hypothetical protein
MTEADGWDFGEPQQPGGGEPAMASDNGSRVVDQNRIGKAESADALGDLADLTGAVYAGIAIGLAKGLERAPLNRQLCLSQSLPSTSESRHVPLPICCFSYAAHIGYYCRMVEEL